MAHNRIAGRLYNRPDKADGARIVTSPVFEVRLMGETGHPVAITEQGSVYWLDNPADSFGLDQAEAFVVHMMRRSHQDDDAQDTRPVEVPALVLATEFHPLPRHF